MVEAVSNPAIAELAAQMQAHHTAGRFPESVAAADSILALDPVNENALLYKGDALVRMKEVAQRAQARETLERLLKINPRHFEAAFGLMTIYLAIGPLEAARKLLPRLIAGMPDDPRLAEMKRELDARLADTIEVPEKEAGGTPAKRRRINRARYPDALGDFADLRAAVIRYLLPKGPAPVRFLENNARGFTMGSCFAGRIARELVRHGTDVAHMQLAETVNTTFANLEFLRWLENDGSRHGAYFEREIRERRSTREEVRGHLAGADFVVYTLGVAPAFFERATGRFVPHEADDFRQFSFLAEHEYRTSTVEENVANLREIHGVLKRVHPGVRLVLTVSPVPLAATFEMESAIIADCISKSVLRAAAHEFLKGAGDDVVYWPSYEIVRWIGGHTGGAFGGDDGSNHHVTDALVTLIVDLFIERFGQAVIGQNSAPAQR